MATERPDFDIMGEYGKVDPEKRAAEIARLEAQGEALDAIGKINLEALRAVHNVTPEDSQGEPDQPELSADNLQTLATLKANFDAREATLQTGIKWEEVAAKLKTSPEKLAVLQKLIARGGEPTVTARLANGNFRFDELSDESPTGNRDVNADRAEEIAKELGAELTEPAVYDSFRSKGIVLDRNTWSWLRTSKEVRKTGYAFAGYLGYSLEHDAYNHFQDDGLRCSLEV